MLLARRIEAATYRTAAAAAIRSVRIDITEASQQDNRKQRTGHTGYIKGVVTLIITVALINVLDRFDSLDIPTCQDPPSSTHLVVLPLSRIYAIRLLSILGLGTRHRKRLKVGYGTGKP